MAWYGESRRHSLSAKGIPNAPQRYDAKRSMTARNLQTMRMNNPPSDILLPNFSLPSKFDDWSEWVLDKEQDLFLFGRRNLSQEDFNSIVNALEDGTIGKKEAYQVMMKKMPSREEKAFGVRNMTVSTSHGQYRIPEGVSIKQIVRINASDGRRKSIEFDSRSEAERFAKKMESELSQDGTIDSWEVMISPKIDISSKTRVKYRLDKPGYESTQFWDSIPPEWLETKVINDTMLFGMKPKERMVLTASKSRIQSQSERTGDAVPTGRFINIDIGGGRKVRKREFRLKATDPLGRHRKVRNVIEVDPSLGIYMTVEQYKRGLKS